MGYLYMWDSQYVRVHEKGLQLHSPAQHGTETQQWREILQIGRIWDRLPDHPLCMEREVARGNNTCGLMSSGELPGRSGSKKAREEACRWFKGKRLKVWNFCFACWGSPESIHMEAAIYNQVNRMMWPILFEMEIMHGLNSLRSYSPRLI